MGRVVYKRIGFRAEGAGEDLVYEDEEDSGIAISWRFYLCVPGLASESCSDSVELHNRELN